VENSEHLVALNSAVVMLGVARVRPVVLRPSCGEQPLGLHSRQAPRQVLREESLYGAMSRCRLEELGSMTAKRGTHSLTYLCSAHVSILALKTSLLVRTSLLESGVMVHHLANAPSYQSVNLFIRSCHSQVMEWNSSFPGLASRFGGLRKSLSVRLSQMRHLILNCDRSRSQT
jgi:hypothetical protein